MYTDFFGLKTKPFTITPDPRFLYMSQVHKEALAHLVYGVREKSGFVVITGDVGTGKTTLLNALLQKLPSGMPKVVIKNPNVKQENIYFLLGESIGLAEENRSRDYLSMYESRLKEIGGAALIVDEAQGLSIEMLEEIRLLSNLETPHEKLVHIILLGQPELNATLRSPNLRQLKQRISVKFTISPLSRSETVEYIKHRLRVAGYEPKENALFSPAAMKMVYQRTRGYPRVINILCDNAMLAAYTEDSHEVTPKIIKQVANEIEGTYKQTVVIPMNKDRLILACVAVVVVLGGIMWFAMSGHNGKNEGNASERTERVSEAAMLKPSSDTRPHGQNKAENGIETANNGKVVSGPVVSAQLAVPMAASLPPSVSQPRPMGGYVKAQEGDTVAALAQRNYGRTDPDVIKSIREANPGLGNLERLYKGQNIFLPNSAKGILYSVGVAWYHSEVEASAVISDLKVAGYEAAMFPLVDSDKRLWFMIALGRFSNREDAGRHAQELAGKGFLYAKPVKISMEG